MGDTTVTGNDNTVVEDNSDDAMQIWVDSIGEKQCSWQSILAGIIGTYGFVRQVQLQERMVDCAEAQKEQAQDYLDLTREQYDDVFKPIYDCIKTEFIEAQDCFSQYEKDFVQLAFDCEPYEPDYVSQQGRVLGTVQAQFDNGNKQRRRQLGKYETGRCKSENLRFALAAATAKTDALNAAYRYEEARRDRYEEVYWGRKVQAVSVAQNVIARSFGALTSSGSVVSAGLGAIGTAFGRSLDAYGAFAGATSGLSDIFGTLANGAFQYAGYQSFGRGTPIFNAGASTGGSILAGIGPSGGGFTGSISSAVSGAAGSLGGALGGLLTSATPPAITGFGNNTLTGQGT